MTEQERNDNERDRVEAEEGRVIAESDRVDAEAGEGGLFLEASRVDAEEGRTIAETDRVAADIQRGEEAYLVYHRVTTLWAMRFALIFLIPVLIFALFSYRENRRLDDTIDALEQETIDRCNNASANRDIIRLLVANGLESLGYTYVIETNKFVENAKGPIDYYKTRPVERTDALVRTIRILNESVPRIICKEDND